MLLAQNWERFKVMNPNLSQYKIDEVEKMLHCRDPKYGFLTYKCAKCDPLKLFRWLVRVAFVRNVARNMLINGPTN
jgi:hypothetical protein